jgi:hypothetical protein
VYFVLIYEIRRMRPIEIVLKWREEAEGERWRG